MPWCMGEAMRKGGCSLKIYIADDTDGASMLAASKILWIPGRVISDPKYTINLRKYHNI